MLPPVLLELRANASEFMGSVKEARASLGGLATTGDVTADKIQASVARQVAAEKELAARVGADFDAEARSAKLTADAIDRSVAQEEAACKRAGLAFDSEARKAELASKTSTAAAEKPASAWSKYGGTVRTVMAGAGAAVAVESLKMAADFQQQITLLHTAGGESEKNLGVVASGIKNIATSTGTSLEQLTEGMYTVEKAGDRGAAGLQVLKAAAEGAKAENVDLGTATNALTSIMMSYHMTTSQATSAENMLVAGAGAAKTTMQSYAGSLSSVLPVASAAGISFSQVGGAIATLTQHGTSAEEATQELANTIRSLQAPNAVASKMMQQLGINVTDLSSHLGQRGLTGTIGLVTDAIAKNMGPSGLVVVNAFKQSQSAAADAQTEIAKLPVGLQTLAKSYQDGSIKQTDWNKSLKSMTVGNKQLMQQVALTVKQSRGFNDLLKAGNPAAQTFAGTLNKVMGGATGMNTALMLSGENTKYFAAATRDVAAAGQKSGANISSWAQTQKNLSVQLAQAKQMVEVLAVDIGSKLIPVVSAVVGFFVQHKVAAEALAVVIGGVMVVAIASYVAKLAWGAAETVGKLALMVAGWMGIGPAADAAAAETEIAGGVMDAAFGPVGLAIAGVVLAATLLATHWQQVWGVVKEVAAAAWNDVLKPVFGWIVNNAVHPLMDAVHVFAGVWSDAWSAVDSIVSYVADHWKQIIRIALVVFLGPLGVAIDVLWTHWKTVWGAIRTVTTDVWNNGLRPVFEFIKRIGIDQVKLEVQVFERVWSTSWHAMTTVISGAWNDVIRPVFGFVYSYGIKPLWSAMELFGNAWSAIWGGVQTVIQDVWNIIKPILDTMKSAISDTVGAVGKVAGAVGHGIGKAASFLGLDTGGAVPGAIGAPTPAIVHGGEYMLSHDMLTGASPIDPDVAAAVFANVAKSSATAGALSSRATGGGSKVSSLSGARSSGGGGGGDGSVVEVHSHLYIDGQQFIEAVQKQQLRMGMRRGLTFAPYKR